jgi:hypothetical protein
MKEQERMLLDAKSNFKSNVLTMEVRRTIQQFTKQALGEFGAKETLGNNLSETLLPTQIKYMGGIIKNEHMISFRRSIFRQLRGKTYVHTFPILLDAGYQLVGDDFDQNRNVFILAFQGGSMTEERVRRICNAYADTAQCDVLDVNLQSLEKDIDDNRKTISDLKDFIKTTSVQFKEILKTMNGR